LSILDIVNFSLTATWALYHFGVETEHFFGLNCRNSGHTIANLELARSVTDLRLVDVTYFIYSKFFEGTIDKFTVNARKLFLCS